MNNNIHYVNIMLGDLRLVIIIIIVILVVIIIVLIVILIVLLIVADKRGQH